MQTPAHLDSQETIRLIQEGRSQVLGQIYDQYREEFLHWGERRFKGKKEDLLDAWQDAVIAFYEQVASHRLVELRCSLRTYLFAIGCKRMLKNHRKMNRLLWRDEVDIVLQEVAVMTAYDWDDPWLEEKDQLLAAMELLQPQCQELLLRRYYDERSIQEIMQEWNYNNLNTVSASLSRCLKKLKELILSNEKPRS